jgi:hypothetical protein
MIEEGRMSTAQNQVSSPPVAAKKKWAEDMQARFPKGTFARIAAVLKQFEDRTDLVREAVERELQRRELLAKKKPKR